MNTIVEELNNGLKKILDELQNKKDENEETLSRVNEKINEKVNEAKQYKVEVDNAKKQINILEEEIKSLEVDLLELNEKFKKKDLTAIIETANIEINSKIEEKQEHIAKHRQKISELTEKARNIKDLLMNLKKDKIIKEDKSRNYNKVYTYYSDSLSKIIEFTKMNSNNLTIGVGNYDYLKSKHNTEETKTEVFDEIESIDNDLNNKKVDSQEVKEDEKILDDLNNSSFDLEYNNIFEDDGDNLVSELENNDNELEKPKEDLEFTPLPNVFDEEIKENKYANDEKFLDELKKVSLDLDDLENKVDLEYNNIFDKKDNDVDKKLENNNKEIAELKKEPKNELEDSNLPDIFGSNTITEEELNQNIPTIEEFFKNYALDFERFDSDTQINLRKSFSPEMFKKIMNVLENNNIDLNNIYDAGNIFIEISPIDLEKIISELLLAGQNISDIGFVLNSLPYINTTNLNEAVLSFGSDIKNINITDLIMKAKNIGEMNRSD